ncbi:hypothetical protein EXIGLDRAFT_752404 [Exidia glandulosa HHB12029]|uniref:Uncharacterized protein n=1 Tax=Exidia glandulosa HHB12029 TaxID=1314781 RepID=A0A165EKL2_EXIGL|nr:hypothetical protein EXIGLDRAFT_752404 [Exidia glandulosa HHB12029]
MSSLNPDRYAGPAEAVLLREQITQDTKDSRQLQTRVQQALTAQHNVELALAAATEAAESARGYTHLLLAQESAVQQRLTRAHGLLHPIRSLPDDILVEIFRVDLDLHWRALQADDDDDDDLSCFGTQNVPFKLAAVCRRWRQLAIATPVLWSFLVIDLEAIDGFERWTSYVRTMRQRLKNLRLPVSIYLRAGSHLLEQTVDSSEFWEEMCALAYHTRSIVAIVASDILLRGPSPGWCRFMTSQFNSLKDLAISNGWGRARDLIVFPRALHLATLSVYHFWLSWDDLPALDGLRNVTLSPQGSVTGDQLGAAVSKMPCVEYLSLQLSVLQTSSDTRQISLPRLHTLKLSTRCDEPSALVFSLPVIEALELSLGGSTGNAMLMDILHAAQVPSLRKLSINSHSIRQRLALPTA